MESLCKIFMYSFVLSENLNYVKWLSLRNSPHIDDWCLDRISRIFNETLEYIDVSGCKNLTDKGIGTLHRCR